MLMNGSCELVYRLVTWTEAIRILGDADVRNRDEANGLGEWERFTLGHRDTR
ncbi:hypothetical protein ES708_21786 [subsurface metagenome]